MLLDDRTEDGTLRDPHPLRSRFAAPPAAPRPPDPVPVVDDLPPELAFLLAQGVAPALLGRAARIADGAGVSGEAALFGLGFPDERYVRLLARHLGAPYLRRPPALERDGLDVVAAAEVGWARLASRPGEAGHVFAPRGDGLRLLLDQHRFEDVGTYGFAVTTRRRFEALLRREDAAGFGERMAAGLALWDATLSASGGATRRQAAAALGFCVALAAGIAGAPGPTAMALSAVLLALFAAAVVLRLTVVASSALRVAARPEIPPTDADLPVYTLVVPLFREARVLPRLVRALDALDYPVLCINLTKRYLPDIVWL